MGHLKGGKHSLDGKRQRGVKGKGWKRGGNISYGDNSVSDP